MTCFHNLIRGPRRDFCAQTIKVEIVTGPDHINRVLDLVEIHRQPNYSIVLAIGVSGSAVILSRENHTIRDKVSNDIDGRCPVRRPLQFAVRCVPEIAHKGVRVRGCINLQGTPDLESVRGNRRKRSEAAASYLNNLGRSNF